MKPKRSPKRQKYVCTACGQTKLPTFFPLEDPYTCNACTQAKNDPGTAPEDLETPSQNPLPSPVGDVFSPPNVEVDPTSPTQQELAARTLARRRLLSFVQRFRPKYMAGWVHKDICRRLERFVQQVEEQKSPRLLLAMPVRSGKSEIGSRHFAPWVLGQHPDWEVIAASGSQSLALSFSRYIRDLVRDPSYQALFPQMQLDPSSQSVENWNTTLGGGYLAAGTGSMITGRGAHILIVDDPVRDAEAADSKIIRDSVWEWYMSTALTRLAPGGGVLGIMTFWNDDDWAGRIQQAMATGDGDQFEIVKYPAINDIGDEYILPDDTIVQIPPGAPPPPPGSVLTRPKDSALHPDRYTLEMLLKRKSNYYALGQQRWWSALYQQNPSPEEGAYFTRDQFQMYSVRPQREGRAVYQAWDFAITEKQKSDWTVGVTILQDENDCLYVLDVLRFRSGDGIDIINEVVRYAQLWQPQLVGFEDGQIWKSLASTFTKVCQEQRYYPSYEVLVPLTDKLVRAQPLRGRMQAKKMFFPMHAPWFADVQHEMLRFPNGAHDDATDSLSWAVRLTLTRAAPTPRVTKALPSWKDTLFLHEAAGGASHMAA